MSDSAADRDAHDDWLVLLGIGIPPATLLAAVALIVALQQIWPGFIALGGSLAGPAVAAARGRASPRFAAIWFCVAVSLVVMAVLTVREVIGKGNFFLLVGPGGLAIVSACLVFPAGVGIAVGVGIARWQTVGWRMVGLVVAYLAIAALVLPIGPLGGPALRVPSSPSDAAMIQNFYEHQEQFEQLVTMSQQDAKVVRIADDFTWLDDDYGWPRPPSRLGFSEQRWDDYRRLFRETGVKDRLARGEDGEVFFYYWTFGIVPSGAGKGYVYSTVPLAPLLVSLDEIPPSTDVRHTVYRRVSGNWYLFYEAN